MDELTGAPRMAPAMNLCVPKSDDHLAALEARLDQEERVLHAARAILASDACRHLIDALPEGRVADIVIRMLSDPVLCSELSAGVRRDQVERLGHHLALARDVDDDKLHFGIIAVLQRSFSSWESLGGDRYRIHFGGELQRTLTVSRYAPFATTISFPASIDMHYDRERRHIHFTDLKPLAHARIFGINNHLATMTGVSVKENPGGRWEVIVTADVHSWLIQRILSAQGFPPGTTELFPEVVWKLFAHGEV